MLTYADHTIYSFIKLSYIDKSENFSFQFFILYNGEPLIFIIMKPQSPAHRMIQLRRKTQKIVIPKASWDLSGKQNNNLSHNYQTSKSKNSSSKKSSLEKKVNMKKTFSMSQNMLKNTLKNITKHSATMKDSKQNIQASCQKKKSAVKKSETKYDVSTSHNKNFHESMSKLLAKLKKQKQIETLKQSYEKCFSKYTPKNQSERQLLSTFSQHMMFWISKCENLDKMLNFTNKVTLKIDAKNIVSEQAICNSQEQRQHSVQFDSEPSMCSYIVDPKQEIKMKPIREDLKQQLQLNFTKVDYLRKKEIQ